MSTEPTRVKVYNLTDIETPNLKQRALLNQHIAIGGRMCEPGEFVELEDSPVLRADTSHLVAVGALAIDRLPPPYAKARIDKHAGAGPLPIHIQHADIQETKVADPEPAPVQEAPTPAPAGKLKGK